MMLAVIGLWGSAFAFSVGVLGSAAFAGLETGTYVLNKIRLELRTARADVRARRLSRILARPQEMLTALLIANNATHYAITALAVVLFTQAGAANPQFYTTMVVGPLLFVLGEMLPKNLFRVAGETLTYRLSWLVAGVIGVCRWTGLSPLVMLLSKAVLWLTPGSRGARPTALEPRQRVRSFLSEGHAHGVLSDTQSRMAMRLVGLPTTTVGDVMIGRADVFCLAADCPRKRFLELLAGRNFSRAPVWADDPDRIAGIVNIYDVLFDEDDSVTPARHTVGAVRLTEEISVSQALMRLQRAHRSMGIVEAGGRFVGIVTIKDLVEEIVGELEAW